MYAINKQQLIARFVSYATIDTESDPSQSQTPSTDKQKNLANKLVAELKHIGLSSVSIDHNGYVMAMLPSNMSHKTPTIGFIAHLDTSPDFSGANVMPQIIENYNGQDITLNKEKNIILSPKHFKELPKYKGQTLIITNGTTLLGADDKAGITEIVTAMEYLINNPDIKHGNIKVGFTPDEEIGRGAHHFNVDMFHADWAYTIDGGEVGELEYENFNAASAKVICKGKSIHPGYAKDKMVNAILIAQEFMAKLPQKETPQETSGYEGFFHIHDISGEIEKCTIELIIRDHDLQKFNNRKALLWKIVDEINQQYSHSLDEAAVSVEITDQYFNMKEKITPVKHIIDIAEKAMITVGVKPIIKAIRGGTDGAQLSYKGLPCPNIFTGGHNFHGKYEYIPAESMQKATEVIIKIAELTAVGDYKNS